MAKGNSPARMKKNAEESVPLKRVSAKRSKRGVDWLGWFLLIMLAIITGVSYSFTTVSDKVTIEQVWFAGWITAISTGLGVVPFIFLSESPNKFWMGISNAVTGGMMLAASYSLGYEGSTYTEEPAYTEVQGFFGFHPFYRMCIGFAIGSLFIIVTKKVLDGYEHLKMVCICCF